MAKKRLSLEEQADCLERELNSLNWQKDKAWTQFKESQQAFEAIDSIYKRSKRSWAYAQRTFVKAVRKLERLRQKLSAANQADHAAGAKSGQSPLHGNSGE